MDMQEQLRKIQEEAANQLENVRDKAGLDALRLKMLGKKGDLTQLLRSMGQLPAEERPKAGQMINVVRERLTEQMDALDSKIKRIEQKRSLNAKRSTLQSRANMRPSEAFIRFRWCRISCSRFSPEWVLML